MPQQIITRSYDKNLYNFGRNCQIFFPQWLYNFASPPLMNQSSSFSLLTFGAGSVLEYCAPLGSRICEELQWKVCVCMCVCVFLLTVKL